MSRTTKIVLAYALVYLGWGTTYLAIRFAVMDFPVLPGMAFRFGIAGLILFAIVFFQHRAWGTNSAQVRGAVIVGLFSYALAIVFESMAMKRIPSGVACIAMGSAPAVMTIMERWVLGRKMGRFEIVGGAIALLGVVMMALVRSGGEKEPPLSVDGAVLMGTGLLFWCLGALAAKKLPLPQYVRLSTAIQMAAGAGFAVAFSGMNGELSTITTDSFTPRFLWSTLYLIVIGGLIVSSAYNWLLTEEPMVRVSTHLFVNPVVAVIVGFLFGGEPISRTVVTALAIVIAGTAVLLFGDRITARSSGSIAQSERAGR